MLDQIGMRYGCRPSEIINLENDVLAFVFDSLVIRQSEKAKNKFTNNPDSLKKKENMDIENLKMAMNKVRNMKGLA